MVKILNVQANFQVAIFIQLKYILATFDFHYNIKIFRKYENVPNWKKKNFDLKTATDNCELNERIHRKQINLSFNFYRKVG